VSCHVMHQYRRDEEHCLHGIQMYSDPILDQLSDCLHDEPCSTYGRCILAVVGDDPYWADRDRREQARTEVLPEAGPPTVAVRGHVLTVTKVPIAGATVCLNASTIPCATSDETGAFALNVPAHDTIAIALSHAGHASRLIPMTTVGQDVRSLSTVELTDESTIVARYQSTHATFPDKTTGFLESYAKPAPDFTAGLEGMTMSITPASGSGAVYRGPDGTYDPQRTTTSNRASAVFAQIQPGIVEVTFGPENVTCVPLYGWPSERPNTVRVPVAAGFESYVSMQCRK
jgi:hypothetical protein